MILPNLFLIMDLAAARIPTKAARRLTANTLSNSSSVIRISRLSRVMPALFTRMPIPSCSEASDSSTSVNFSVSVMSTHLVIIVKPASLTAFSRSASWPAIISRPATMRSCFSSSRTIARPIPLAAPVAVAAFAAERLHDATRSASPRGASPPCATASPTRTCRATRGASWPTRCCACTRR